MRANRGTSLGLASVVMGAVALLGGAAALRAGDTVSPTGGVSSVLATAASRSADAAAGYVVAISSATDAIPEWAAVANALVTKHSAVKVLYPTGTPSQAQAAIAQHQPHYVCFVAQPQEISNSFVASCHQLTRQLDSDPYGDAIWGIVTGRTPADALRVAQAGAVPVDFGLMKTGGDWLYYLQGGEYHAEGAGSESVKWARAAGGEVVKTSDGPTDDTARLAQVLNGNGADLVVTSGHASQTNWQLHYPTASPEGYFMSNDGQLYGRDAGGAVHNINSSNAKLYYAPGNCLIAQIPQDATRDDCMALGWLGTGGAAQMYGYVVSTWFGYSGWGVSEYFIRQQDRFTFGESVFANNQSLLFDIENGTPRG